jgi:two-component system chemotaxis response regulator CheY
MEALVVDDSKAMRTILKRIVSQCGFEVCQEAGDGLEALRKLHDGYRPRLVLVDYNMPEMNGIEFVAAMRTNPEFHDVTVVMITTETSIERMEQALAAGADEYVMKPFTPDVLIDKLEIAGVATVSA